MDFTLTESQFRLHIFKEIFNIKNIKLYVYLIKFHDTQRYSNLFFFYLISAICNNNTLICMLQYVTYYRTL